MKIKKIMIGLLSLLSLSQGVLAKEVGSCPLPKDIVTTYTFGSLKFELAPQPKAFKSAYFASKNKKMICVYDTVQVSAAIASSNCTFSKQYQTAACPNPAGDPTKCILYCQ